jgi:hypothetical protein
MSTLRIGLNEISDNSGAQSMRSLNISRVFESFGIAVLGRALFISLSKENLGSEAGRIEESLGIGIGIGIEGTGIDGVVGRKVSD